MYNLAFIFKILFDGITHPEYKYLLRASICWLPNMMLEMDTFKTQLFETLKRKI